MPSWTIVAKGVNRNGRRTTRHIATLLPSLGYKTQEDADDALERFARANPHLDLRLRVSGRPR